MKKNEDKSIGLNSFLKEYMSREPSYTFRVKWEEEKVEKRRFTPLKILACASLLLVFAIVGVGVFSYYGRNNADELGFMITAFASNSSAEDGKALGYKIKGLNDCGPLVAKEEDALHYDRIGLSITGESVESYDISTTGGYFNFFDRKNRVTPENALGEEVYSYFAKGSKLVKLPVAPADDPDEAQLYWFPGEDKLMADIDESKDVFKQQCALLKTAEDYNKYFAATVTATVRYTDGREESVKIDISFDKNGYVSAVMRNKTDLVDVY